MKHALKQALLAADMPGEASDVDKLVSWAFGGSIGQDNGNRMAIAWNELHPGTFLLHATDPQDEVAQRVVAAYRERK